MGRICPEKGFHLAIDAGVPILPVTVNGSHSLFPKAGRVVRPGALDVIVGRAIPTAGLGKERLDDLMAATRLEILEARRRDPGFVE